MKVVNPDNTSHSFLFVPRYYDFNELELVLTNPATGVTTEVANTNVTHDGFTNISFDFTFANNDKYEVVIKEEDEIVYRGKLIATDQATQSYKLTAGFYRYEWYKINTTKQLHKTKNWGK